jgi:hypothetical protein
MQIYIHRDNEDFGPYSTETALGYVSQGIFQVTDYGWYAGLPEWKTVGELLGIGAASEPARSSTQAGASPRIRNTTPLRQQTVRVRRMSTPVRKKKGGWMLALNVVLVLVVAAAAYIRFASGGETARHYLAAMWTEFAGPAAESPKATLAAPASVAAIKPDAVEVAVSTPPPSVVSTPAPPKAFDPADLAGNPGAWPKTVRLKQSVVFPAVFNSQVVGSVTVPRGAVVNLVSIQGDQLILAFQGGTQKLSWKLTDIEEEVAKAGGAGPSAATMMESGPGSADAPATANDQPASDGNPPGLAPQAPAYFGVIVRK